MLDNIKSRYIIKVIFANIRNKIKLNIIKFNKKLKARLNVTKEDLEIYIILKDFINKYGNKIEDIDIKEININSQLIKNEGLKDLFKLKFKFQELKK